MFPSVGPTDRPLFITDYIYLLMFIKIILIFDPASLSRLVLLL